MAPLNFNIVNRNAALQRKGMEMTTFLLINAEEYCLITPG
jgi:hypothetical protein